jgi:hypothetical protein
LHDAAPRHDALLTHKKQPLGFKYLLQFTPPVGRNGMFVGKWEMMNIGKVWSIGAKIDEFMPVSIKKAPPYHLNFDINEACNYKQVQSN